MDLVRFPDNEAIQTAGCDVLTTLCMHPSNRDPLCAIGAVSPILQCLRLHPDARACQQAASTAISFLARSPRARVLFLNLGAVPAVCHTLHSHANSPSVVAAACRALAALVGAIQEPFVHVRDAPDPATAAQARRQIFSVNGDGAVVSALATHMGDAEVVVPIVELLHALCRHLQDEHYAKMVVRIAKLDGRRLFQVRGRGEGGAVRRRGGGTQQRRGMEKGGRRGGGGGRVSGAVSFEKSVRELGFEARTLGAAGWGAGFDGEERS
mmetsp:Transcript_54755/g.128018  ORF Transcript_54755/g.128018 Transcript_54755/m.128018 type:complete len:267 (+) Transcript_54755:68-868(+)